jgi:hypothetical protein
MLLTNKFYPSKTTRRGRRVTFWFDRKETKGHRELWLSGKPMPVSDIRDVFEAYRLFNRIVFEGK